MLLNLVMLVRYKTIKTVNNLTIDEINEVKQLLIKFHPPIYTDIFNMGLNVGLRISELLSIRFDNIKDGSLGVNETKTKKTKHVSLNNTALKVVTKRRAQYPDDEYVFTSHANRSTGVDAVSTRAVRRIFEHIAQSLNIRFNTHSMRKTFLTNVYNKSGFNLALVMSVSGHSSKKELLRYLGLPSPSIPSLDVVDAYHEYEIK